MAVLRNIALTSILLYVSTFSYSQSGKIRQLSLQEALTIGGTQSYQIQIAMGQLQKARGQNLESLSGFLPRVSVSENYTKSNDPVTAFSLKLKQGIFTQDDFSLATLNNPDALDNFTTSVQIQQPVLNLDAIYGKSAAKLGVRAREEALNRTKEAVALQVKKAYYGLVLSRENFEAINQAVASARAHRDDARIAFEQGIINQADYLAAEVRLAELQEKRITLEHQIANAVDHLKFVIGMEDESFIVPTDSLGSSDAIHSAEDLNRPIAERSDLRALKYQSRAAQRHVWMKRSAWIPRLNALGAFEWNASEAFRKDASNWTVGLQLKWQLFEGLGMVGRSKQAAAEAEVVAVQYRQAGEQAELEVRQARRALRSAKERVRVAESAVAPAAESLRIIEERFEQGLEKASDLLDKEVVWTNAKLRVLKAKHDYTIALSELQFALEI